MNGTINLTGSINLACRLSTGTINLAFAAGLLLAASTAGALETPSMQSLRAAASAPMGATLESQSMAAGASFAGNAGGSGVQGSAAGGARATRFSAPDLKASSGKETIPSPSSNKEDKTLKLVRGVGLAAAAAGAGLMAYAVIAMTAGPIVAAAALLFFGGMAAYLAHRRLKGENDFPPKS